LIFVSQAGRNRHEDVCESLELFAREVMPEFKDRVGAAEEAKARRLAPAVEAALARRAPRRRAPADYAFPSLPAT
jgi:DNA-binding GntR family transcriptional regulator